MDLFITVMCAGTTQLTGWVHEYFSCTCDKKIQLHYMAVYSSNYKSQKVMFAACDTPPPLEQKNVAPTLEQKNVA